MAVRCEYCGQLYEGLSCPHCLAPRTEPARYSYDDELPGVLEGIKNTCDPEWTDDGVSVLYADNIPYFVGGNEGHARDKVVYYPPEQETVEKREPSKFRRIVRRLFLIFVIGICMYRMAIASGASIDVAIFLSVLAVGTCVALYAECDLTVC